MKIKDKKLDFFLSMASMDQQLGLVIYDNNAQLEQIKDFIEENSDEQFEINSLDKFQQIEKGFGIFYLNKDNIYTLLENIQVTPFQSFLKVIFVMEQKVFERLGEMDQEKILKTFSPIFRP